MLVVNKPEGVLPSAGSKGAVKVGGKKGAKEILGKELFAVKSPPRF